MFALDSLFAGRKPMYSWMETQVGKQQRFSKARGLCQLPDPQKNQPTLVIRERESQGAVQGTEPGAWMALPHYVPGHRPAYIYINIMEYYSAIKRNILESVLMRWMKLQPIIQSEVSQKEKNNHHILMHIYGI